MAPALPGPFILLYAYKIIF